MMSLNAVMWIALNLGGVMSTKFVLLAHSRLQIFLIFIPLGVWSVVGGMSPLFVFAFNFCALIPLASLLGSATEELSLHFGGKALWESALRGRRLPSFTFPPENVYCGHPRLQQFSHLE